LKILIELPTWLGDCVMSTASIEGIVQLYPNAKITFFGSSISIGVLKNHPNATNVLEINRSFFSLYKFAKSLGKFDLFFSFRSPVRSSFLKFFVSSERKYQYSNKQYIHGHQVEKYMQFVCDSINVSIPSRKLKIYKKNNNLNLIRPRVGINPGASYGNAKRWYPEEFAKVAYELSDEYEVFIFGGPREIQIANDIEKKLKEFGLNNYRNLAGKTNILELVDYISSLDLLITGDSGPMHLAAAFQVPTIAIFGPTRAEETSQWKNKHSVIVKKSLDCQPCMKRNCPLNHHNCMRLIKADEVLNEVRFLQESFCSIK